jgi:hypothetical protein
MAERKVGKSFLSQQSKSQKQRESRSVTTEAERK